MLNPIYKSALPFSLYREEERMVFLFPGVKEIMLIEFPPDDYAATFFAAMTDSPDDCQIALKESPKQIRKWSSLTPRLTDPAFCQHLEPDVLQQLRAASAQPAKYFVPTLDYYAFSAGGRSGRYALQAHPGWAKDRQQLLKPGVGPICSVASGASLGCAFITRARYFDGKHFNDPLAAYHLSRVDSTGFGFGNSNQALLNLLIAYTEEKRDAALSLIAHYKEG